MFYYLFESTYLVGPLYVWTRQLEARHHYYSPVLYVFNLFFACLKMYSQLMYCNLEETVLQFLIFGIRKITIETNKQTFTNKTTAKLVKLSWFPSLFVYGRVLMTWRIVRLQAPHSLCTTEQCLAWVTRQPGQATTTQFAEAELSPGPGTNAPSLSCFPWLRATHGATHSGSGSVPGTTRALAPAPAAGGECH